MAAASAFASPFLSFCQCITARKGGIIYSRKYTEASQSAKILALPPKPGCNQQAAMTASAPTQTIHEDIHDSHSLPLNGQKNSLLVTLEPQKQDWWQTWILWHKIGVGSTIWCLRVSLLLHQTCRNGAAELSRSDTSCRCLDTMNRHQPLTPPYTSRKCQGLPGQHPSMLMIERKWRQFKSDPKLCQAYSIVNENSIIKIEF